MSNVSHFTRMTIPEIIAAAKDLFLAIAGATTATVAVIGLNNWNREVRGKATFEVARGLAKTTYKLRDALKSCRSPLIRGTEFPDEYNVAGPRKSSEQEAQAYAHIYANRWAPVWSALQEFDTHTLEAEAMWGSGIRTKTDELRKGVRELNVAIEAVVANAASGGEDFSTDREFGKKMRSTVAATPGDAKNEFTVNLEAAVRGIEDELRPHLKRG